MTKTHRWSCHGKIFLDSFQVVLLCGWLSTRPIATCRLSSSSVTMPVARAASQKRSSAWRSVDAGRIWSVA